jgi:O-phospho-L-seryl-tRNASec:L-selenocysteinyl-tRNA synthase
MAKKYGIYHVVNNAYGIWCSKIANSLKEAQRKGECTAVIQSTDKNFMVPVGGSFIFCQQQPLLDKSIFCFMQSQTNIREGRAAVR